MNKLYTFFELQQRYAIKFLKNHSYYINLCKIVIEYQKYNLFIKLYENKFLKINLLHWKDKKQYFLDDINNN